MKSGNTIRKIISAILFVVFALSITPKTVLHGLVARHTDSSRDVQKGLHIESAGFHCNIDNLVAEAPFLFQNNECVFNVQGIYNHPVERIYAFIHSDPLLNHSLRGPPVFIA